MKTRKRFFAVAVSYAISILISTSALAADFVLKVPLDVKYLDVGFPRAIVRCEVSAMKDGARTVIGSGVAQVGPDPNTGSLRVSNVEVGVTALAGNDPRSADRYRCQLYLTLMGMMDEVAIDCSNQSFTVATTDDVGAFRTGPFREARVRDTTKPCRSIVEGNIGRR